MSEPFTFSQIADRRSDRVVVLMEQIQRNWLHALGIVRHVGVNSQKVYTRTEIVPIAGAAYAFEPVHHATENRTVLFLRPYDDFYEIEQIEMLCSAAIWIQHQINPMSAFQMQRMRKAVGCHASRVIYNPAHRWRELALQIDSATSPLNIFENRPVCGMCKGIVATGAGYDPLADDRLSIFANVSGGYRPRIHHECYRYGHRLLLELQKAQIAEAKAATPAEIDK